MNLRQFSIAAIAVFGLAAPAFADPDGIRVSHDLIVAPLDRLGNLERWNLEFSYPRKKPAQAAANAPDIWTAGDPDPPPGGGEWFSSGLMKIGLRTGNGEYVALRLWTRAGGALWVKPMAAGAPDVLVSYKIQVGHDSFILASKSDGTVHVDGQQVGKVG